MLAQTAVTIKRPTSQGRPCRHYADTACKPFRRIRQATKQQAMALDSTDGHRQTLPASPLTPLGAGLKYSDSRLGHATIKGLKTFLRLQLRPSGNPKQAVRGYETPRFRRQKHRSHNSLRTSKLPNRKPGVNNTLQNRMPWLTIRAAKPRGTVNRRHISVTDLTPTKPYGSIALSILYKFNQHGK